MFPLERNSTEEMVPLKTADTVLCGLFRVMGTSILERDVAVEF